MSQFYEYNWSNIALLTELAAAQNVVLNQALDLTGTKYWEISRANIIKYGSIRKITLSSTAILNVVNFQIVGTQNGILLNEILGGPNNNTVSSVNYYDTIISITPVTGVVPVGARISVSMSVTGYMPVIILNSSRNTGLTPFVISFVVAAANPVTYTTYLSLKDCVNTDTYANHIANKNFIEKVPANPTTSQLIQSQDCARNLLIGITTNANNTTLKFQFFQPSI